MAPFPINSSNDWNKTIYEGTATYKFSDENMVYARYSQGFRSGGFSNRGNDPAFLSFGPENADAYEIGSKNEFFDHRVQFNLTGFYTIIQEAQFNSVLTTNGVPPGTNTIVNNASGDIDTYGVEVQAAWLINDLLSIVATYGWQDNEVDEFDISSERFRSTPTVLRVIRSCRRLVRTLNSGAKISAVHRNTTIPCRGSTRRISGHTTSR